MPRYVALLRAINVGGHTVKMDRLRALFEALGLASVETFIASGNVIFDTKARDASALATRIEQHLRASLGYEVKTFLRTPAELAAAAARRPFGDGDLDAPGALYVGFVAEPLGADAQARLDALATPADTFHVDAREFYWLARAGIGQSPITTAKLERALGAPTTMRNVTTVTKLAEKYGG